MLDAATIPATDSLDRLELSEELAAAYTEEPVTYTAVLPVSRRAVRFVADLLEDVKPDRLAVDLAIGRSTAHRDVAETLDVVAGRAPGLHGALLAARAAGHRHVNLDGTLIRTDRVSTPGPTSKKTTKGSLCSGPKREKVDLFWSGKHRCQGGTGGTSRSRGTRS